MSNSTMDWEAQYNSGVFEANTAALARSSKTRKSKNDALALDSDNEDQDVTMASASASAHTSTRARLPSAAPDIYIPEDEESLVSQLTKHWLNERHAPDILPAQEELLASLLDYIRRQSDAVQLLRGQPSASEEEHIRIMLVQMEVERVKFIVRSYVRTRLYKIEKFARFIMGDATIQTRLTTAERTHAQKHAELTDAHFYNSVLQSLPETQSHLDDTPIFMPPMSSSFLSSELLTSLSPYSLGFLFLIPLVWFHLSRLVTKPDESRPVFVHALRDCPPIRFHEDLTLEMKRGHISLMPYSFIEQLLLRGDVELI
ncbi:Sld5-domain-containing protein [Lentinula raphanica]|nr:Sld5-domain-containing protein [Lentinula raphanica]